MRKLIVLMLGTLLFSTILSAQTKLNMMSGKILDVDSVLISEETLTCTLNLSNGKSVPGHFEKYRVYSIETDGKVTVIYEQDSAHGRKYTQDEMFTFIMGERDAEAVHKSPGSLIAGGVLGLAGGTYFAYSGFWIGSLPVAFASTFLLTALPTKIKSESVANPTLLKEVPYFKGYKRVAKNKKLHSAMLGTVAGTVAGIVIGLVAQ